MNQRNRPEEAWKKYRAAAYGHPGTLDQVQERECSLSFYAGMITAFNMMAVIAARAVDDDAGSDELERLRQEIAKAAAISNLDRNDGKS